MKKLLIFLFLFFPYGIINAQDFPILPYYIHKPLEFIQEDAEFYHITPEHEDDSVIVYRGDIEYYEFFMGLEYFLNASSFCYKQKITCPKDLYFYISHELDSLFEKTDNFTWYDSFRNTYHTLGTEGEYLNIVSRVSKPEKIAFEEPEFMIVGTVTDVDTKKPIRNAKVELISSAGEIFTTRSDKGGFFYFVRNSKGERYVGWNRDFQLNITAKGYMSEDGYESTKEYIESMIFTHDFMLQGK